MPQAKGKKVTSRRGKVTDADIAAGLRQCKGLVTATVGWLAKEKGISVTRQTVSSHISRSPALQAVQAEIEAETLDYAEGRLLSLIAEGDRTAIIFYLKCKGKTRGYTERQEIAGAADSPLVLPTIKVEYVDSPDDYREVEAKGFDTSG